MNSYLKVTICVTGIILLESCNKNEFSIPSSVVAGWTEESHGNSVSPDYDLVFPQTMVNTITINLGLDSWEKIEEDMTSLSGNAFGTGGGLGGRPNQGGGLPNGAPPAGQPGGGFNPGGGQGGAVSIFSRDPIYVGTSISFNDKTWEHVGFRLKGNSSLSKSWSSGVYKLPFRLHFDKMEDEFPAVKDQRFYGFKELSFSPAFNDPSLMREKLAADLFRNAGIPAAQTSFCKVYIDFGEGVKYCGVYTIVEVIDDTMVESQYGEKDGNIYKPESTLQSFLESQFEKKNNKEQADFSDVRTLVERLNSSDRLNSKDSWKNMLEKVFDVDHFLNYLAINNTIVNWDSYGGMAHNYYLYNHKGSLKWIPWDHNEALSLNNRSINLELTGVSSNWPLISYLAEDTDYYQQYRSNVNSFVNGAFEVSLVHSMIDKNYNLIKNYVIGAEPEVVGYTYLTGSESFENGVSALKNHVESRYETAKSFSK
ncbi:hypothetical protein TK44_12360 [Jiulongibacter sediminis]|nr:hypothetical protein TK44_12360 [Jiulongibacter sediminis]